MGNTLTIMGKTLESSVIAATYVSIVCVKQYHNGRVHIHAKRAIAYSTNDVNPVLR